MANTEIETVNATSARVRLALVVVCVLGGLVAFYMLRTQGPMLQWAGFLLGLAFASVVLFTSSMGHELIAFGRDSWKELQKVVWPTRKETMQTTAFVFAFAVVMALFLWFTDKTLEWLLYDLILGWRR